MLLFLLLLFNFTHARNRLFFVEHPIPRYACVNFYDKKKKTADSICMCNGSYQQQQQRLE
jgi:hypothetical protein